MARLFADHPRGGRRERCAVFERLAFSLDELRYEYPLESAGEQRHALRRAGAAHLGGRGRALSGRRAGRMSPKRSTTSSRIIRQLDYEPYFLTVRDIVHFARSQGILCQGRGSAANSAVCYCLRHHRRRTRRAATSCSSASSRRSANEPPDIDVDFEHERREEVIQYVYEKYGRDHAGIAATVITYRSRSAAREVGKAFGLSEDAVGALAGNVWGWSSDRRRRDGRTPRRARPADRGVGQVLEMTREIIGFPRHLSQHVGGFVITRSRLDEVVPVLNSAMDGRTIIEWDKDDLDALKMLKIDVLALGMLTCLKRGFDLLDRALRRAARRSPRSPRRTPQVYDMICRADTIGVFQIESRAQMTMLPRLRPRTFYDLVIEVAIVRPGPIQGDMVHPYLRRRQGIETVDLSAARRPSTVRRTSWRTCSARRSACRSSRSRRCGSPSWRRSSSRARPTSCAAPWRRSGASARSARSRTKMVEGMVSRGYDARLRRTLLQPDRGLWRIRLSGKPRGELRAPRLRLVPG